MDKKGFETTTKNREMAIMKNSRRRVTARREKSMYHLKTNSEVVLTTGQESLTSVTVLAQLHIWHKSRTLPGSPICTVACLLRRCLIPCL